MKEAAIYIRVSTDKQEADNQLFELKEYCEKNEYHIFGIYDDIISGKETSRPQWDRLFSHARKRFFNTLLFWDLSRFSRSGTLFTLQKLRELENLGIEWVSYKEPYFSTAGEFKEVLLSIMSTLAKIERERLSDRTKAGLRKAKNVGKRGKDKKPRKIRTDRGLKRGVQKTNLDYLETIRKNEGIKNGRF